MDCWLTTSDQFIASIYLLTGDYFIWVYCVEVRKR